jgi:hypothetical protein
MKTRLLLIVLLLMPLMSHANEAAKPPRPPFKNRGTPEEFLRDLYSRYDATNPGAEPQLLNRDTRALADPELQKLILKEEELSHGEPGIIDSDPICDCQDFDKASVQRVDLLNKNKDSVEAKITFSLAKEWTGYVETYQLIKINGVWKIHDIKYNHTQVDGINLFTLADTLKYAIKAYSKGK